MASNQRAEENDRETSPQYCLECGGVPAEGTRTVVFCNGCEKIFCIDDERVHDSPLHSIHAILFSDVENVFDTTDSDEGDEEEEKACADGGGEAEAVTKDESSLEGGGADASLEVDAEAATMNSEATVVGEAEPAEATKVAAEAATAAVNAAKAGRVTFAEAAAGDPFQTPQRPKRKAKSAETTTLTILHQNIPQVRMRSQAPRGVKSTPAPCTPARRVTRSTTLADAQPRKSRRRKR